MNIFDYILIIIIGLNVYGGFRLGLLRQVGALFGILLGLFIAFQYHASISQWFDEMFNLRDFFTGLLGGADRVLPGLPDALLMFLSLLVIFIVCAVLGSYVGRLAARLVQLVKLSFLDRLAGSAMGLLKGLLIALIIVHISSFFSMTAVGGLVENSSLAPRFLEYAPQIFEEMKDFISNNIA